MWRGMWSAGRDAGGGDDPERRRCVTADAARKRSARRYTNNGLSPPPSLLHRETEEYDRKQALLRRGLSSVSSTAGRSSAGASSSWTPLTPVKREPEELPPLRAVKRKPEAEAERRGVIGPEDYLPPAEADVMEAAIVARSAREEEEAEQRRRRDADIYRIFLEQGIAATQEFTANMEEWRLVAKKQDEVYVDLVSDDED